MGEGRLAKGELVGGVLFLPVSCRKGRRGSCRLARWGMLLYSRRFLVDGTPEYVYTGLAPDERISGRVEHLCRSRI